jgi:endonuclease/exonuclease/phosphatase family metal-dependent hydrolase
MPFYPSLKIYPSNSSKQKNKKKRVAQRIKNLKQALQAHFKASSTQVDTTESVRIATWNLREFGGSKYKGRDFECVYYIAEIISHFDLVALQEVRIDMDDYDDFDNLLRILGPSWTYIATDVTDGSAGNKERMVFLYNRKKVFFKNIVGELTLKEGGKIKAHFGERIKLEQGLKLKLPNSVNLSGTYSARLKTSNGKKKLDADLEIPLPDKTFLELPEGTYLTLAKNTSVTSPGRGKANVTIPNIISGDTYRLRFMNDVFDDSLRQFARTPFLISFQAGWLKLNLCTVHIYYGDNSKRKLEQRRSEIEMLTKALANKAKAEFKEDKEAFLGVLGDFNIIGKGHPTMEALESNGFLIPDEIKSIPGSNVKKDKAYDQIAFWNPKRNTEYAKLDIKGANVFDFFEHVFKTEDETIYRNEDRNGLKANTSYNDWRTYKMSDHLPMWIELRTDFGKEYLDNVTG